MSGRASRSGKRKAAEATPADPAAEATAASKAAAAATKAAAKSSSAAPKPTKKQKVSKEQDSKQQQEAPAREQPKRKAKAAAGNADKTEQKEGRKNAKKQQQQQQQEQPAAADKPKRKGKKQSKKQQQQEEEEKSVHEQYMELIAAKEKELKKHCIILEQAEGDEDETTLEELLQLKKVFVPEKTWEEFVEVWGELDEVGNESDEGDGDDEGEDGSDGLAAFMAAFMGKFLSTQHSAQMHTIFNSHLKAVDKAIRSKSWQDAFCHWAAIVMAARRESHWWEDTDVPDAAAAIYNKLREQWAKLKARSDEELGGLVCEGQLSAKEELGTWLQGMADEMRQMEYDVVDVA